MKLIECYVEGFGRLKRKTYSFTPGLNCIYAENGSGKTTLSYFITAMLYGISDTRKQRLEENERRRFIPWDGTKCGGSLTLEADGRGYRIERSFGTRASEDTLAIYDANTGTPLRLDGDNPGEALFGIDRGGFERSVFLSERNLSDNLSGGGISAKLSGLSDDPSDIGEIEGALMQLEERRRFYYKKGGGGEIGDIKRTADECECRLYALNERAKEYTHRKSEVKRLSDELSRLEEKRKGLHRELSHSREDGNNRMAPSGKFYFLSVIGILLICAGIPLGISVYPYLYIISGVGVLLTVISLASLKKKSSSGKKGGLDGIIRSLDEVDADISAVREQIALSDAECKSLEAELAARDELSRKIEALRKTEKSHEDALRIIQLTEGMLRAAHTSMSKKYLGDITAGFEQYAALISGENAEFNLDTDFNVKRMENGMTHEKDAYSRGTRDLYSLALRMAISDVLYKNEDAPPIILDDPFLSFDDERIRSGGELLRHISRRRQVIYFTCHKSRQI